MKLEGMLTNGIYVSLILLILSLTVMVFKILPILKEIKILFEDVNRKSESLNPLFDAAKGMGDALSKTGVFLSGGLEKLINFFERKEK